MYLNKSEYENVMEELKGRGESSSKPSYEQASEVLLDRYARNSNKFKVDVQEEFFNSLKQNTYSKMEVMKKDIEEKKRKQKQKTENEIKRKVASGNSKNLSDPEKMADDMLKKKEGLSDEDYNNEREEILKMIYAAMIEEYYNLKLEVDKSLAKNNEVWTSNEELENKYLLYQNYIKKIDSKYYSLTGKYISQDDKEVSKKESNFLRYEMRGEYKIEKNRGNSIAKYDKVQNRIEAINEEIIQLSNKYSNGSISANEYDSKIDNLQRELIKENIYLEHMEPTIEELFTMQQRKQEYDNVEQKKLGVYTDKKEKSLMGDDKNIADKKQEQNTEQMVDVQTEQVDSQKDVIDNFIFKAEEEMEKGNNVKAQEYIDKANEIAGYTSSINNNTIDSAPDSSTSKKDKDKKAFGFDEELGRVKSKNVIMKSDINRLKGYSDNLQKEKRQIKQDSPVRK